MAGSGSRRAMAWTPPGSPRPLRARLVDLLPVAGRLLAHGLRLGKSPSRGRIGEQPPRRAVWEGMLTFRAPQASHCRDSPCRQPERARGSRLLGRVRPSRESAGGREEGLVVHGTRPCASTLNMSSPAAASRTPPGFSADGAECREPGSPRAGCTRAERLRAEPACRRAVASPVPERSRSSRAKVGPRGMGPRKESHARRGPHGPDGATLEAGRWRVWRSEKTFGGFKRDTSRLHPARVGCCLPSRAGGDFGTWAAHAHVGARCAARARDRSGMVVVAKSRWSCSPRAGRLSVRTGMPPGRRLAGTGPRRPRGQGQVPTREDPAMSPGIPCWLCARGWRGMSLGPGAEGAGGPAPALQPSSSSSRRCGGDGASSAAGSR